MSDSSMALIPHDLAAIHRNVLDQSPEPLLLSFCRGQAGK